MSIQTTLETIKQALAENDLDRAFKEGIELARWSQVLLQPENAALNKQVSDEILDSIAQLPTSEADGQTSQRGEGFALGFLMGTLNVLASAASRAPSLRVLQELSKPASRDLVAALHNDGEHTTTSLAAAVGKDVSGVSRALLRMEKAGLIFHKPKGRAKLWKMTVEGEQAWKQRDHVRDGDW